MKTRHRVLIYALIMLAIALILLPVAGSNFLRILQVLGLLQAFVFCMGAVAFYAGFKFADRFKKSSPEIDQNLKVEDNH